LVIKKLSIDKCFQICNVIGDLFYYNFLLNIGNNGHRLLSRLLGGGGGGKETISDETGFLFSLHFVYSYDFAFFNFCSLHVTIFVARSIFYLT
jgi:hypothetical protein